MKIFTITISEELVRTVWVEAPDSHAAIELVTDKYENGEIVLDAGDYADSSTDIQCVGVADENITPDYTVKEIHQ